MTNLQRFKSTVHVKERMYEQELNAFSKAKTRYLVIGAIALGLHGYPRATMDLDIFPELKPANLEKIIQICKRLHYVPRVPVDPQRLKDPKAREEWATKKNMKVFTYIQSQNPLNTIDIMIYPPVNFDDCYKRKVTIALGKTTIHVASIEDLLKMKNIADRDKDQGDIAILKRMLAEKQDD